MEGNKKIIIGIILVVAVALIGFGSYKLLSKDDKTEVDEEQMNEYKDQYVLNSKKSAYSDMMAAYIDATRTKVNMADELQLFDTEVLYLVPVGNEKCVKFVGNSQSVFDSEYEYFYVGVTYDGIGYDYYVISKDFSSYGLDFSSQKTLASEGKKLIKEGKDLVSVDIAKFYKGNETKKFAIIEQEGYEAISNVNGLEMLANTANRDKIIILSSCEE